jgi:hypothetical protein
MQHRLAARPRTNGSLSVMTSGAKPYRHHSVNGQVSWPRTHRAAAARMISRRGCDARAAAIREAPQTPVNVRSAADRDVSGVGWSCIIMQGSPAT